MKYVVIERTGLETAILFEEFLDHSIFSNMHPISAGFFYLYGADEPRPGSCCCENAIRVSVSHKKSVTLKLGPRPEDEDLITTEIMRHYH